MFETWMDPEFIWLTMFVSLVVVRQLFHFIPWWISKSHTLIAERRIAVFVHTCYSEADNRIIPLYIRRNIFRVTMRKESPDDKEDHEHSLFDLDDLKKQGGKQFYAHFDLHVC